MSLLKLNALSLIIIPRAMNRLKMGLAVKCIVGNNSKSNRLLNRGWMRRVWVNNRRLERDRGETGTDGPALDLIHEQHS